MGRDTSKLIEALRAACPDGVDVYFDNVGSWISDAVYAADQLQGAHRRVRHDRRIQSRDARAGAAHDAAPAGQQRAHGGLHRARISAIALRREALARAGGLARRRASSSIAKTSADGLENAPRALMCLFRAENFGKQLVRIRPDPTRK
jgi:NADPH:quinone reductase